MRVGRAARASMVILRLGAVALATGRLCMPNPTTERLAAEAERLEQNRALARRVAESFAAQTRLSMLVQPKAEETRQC